MLRVSTIAVLCSCLAPLPAVAANWIEPNAAYSGTRVMNSGGALMAGPLYHDHGKERWEVSVNGMQQVMIMRPDLQKMIMYMPQMNMAMEMPLNHGMIPTPELYAGNQPESVGQESLAGESVTKYKVENSDGSGPFTVFFWTTDDGITLRMEGSGRDGQFEMHLENLVRGTQPAVLFEAPAGVQVMPFDPATMNHMPSGQVQ